MGQPASLHKPRGLPFVQPGSLGFHLTSCSDAAARTGQPEGDSVVPRELAAHHGQNSLFISHKPTKPVPRPVINLEQSFLRPFLWLEALAFY